MKTLKTLLDVIKGNCIVISKVDNEKCIVNMGKKVTVDYAKTSLLTTLKTLVVQG